MRRLFLTTLAALSLTGFTAASTQAFPYSLEVDSARYLLCTTQEVIEHHNICPAEELLPAVGLRVTGGANTIYGEPWAERPASIAAISPAAIECGYGLGGGVTGEPYNSLWYGGCSLPRFTVAQPGMPPLPAGANVTAWMYPLIEQVRWEWGLPCQTEPAWLTLYPCGHYVGVYHAEGEGVTWTTPKAPTSIRRASRLKG